MLRIPTRNIVLMFVAFVIAIVPFLSAEPKGVLGHGGAIGLAVFFFMKTTTRLSCTRSDALLALTAAVFVIGTMLVRHQMVMAFEIAAACCTLVFVFTGLRYKDILQEQRRRKEEKRP
jgi:hypothetical protein